MLMLAASLEPIVALAASTAQLANALQHRGGFRSSAPSAVWTIDTPSWAFRWAWLRPVTCASSLLLMARPAASSAARVDAETARQLLNAAREGIRRDAQVAQCIECINVGVDHHTHGNRPPSLGSVRHPCRRRASAHRGRSRLRGPPLEAPEEASSGLAGARGGARPPQPGDAQPPTGTHRPTPAPGRPRCTRPERARGPDRPCPPGGPARRRVSAGDAPNRSPERATSPSTPSRTTS